jgi:hypothetical protein
LPPRYLGLLISPIGDSDFGKSFKSRGIRCQQEFYGPGMQIFIARNKATPPVRYPGIRSSGP